MDLVEPTLMTEETLENIVAFRVACQWHRYWLDAIATGDTEAREVATQKLLEIPTWQTFADMEDFWSRILSHVEIGVIDGPRGFAEANCPEVRDELEAPKRPATITATLAVSMASDPGLLVAPDDRPSVIARLGAEIPVPDGVSFGALAQASHSETEIALQATLRQYAWCSWLGLLIDAGDQGDQRTIKDTLTRMGWFIDPNAPEVDSSTSVTMMQHVLNTAAGGNGFWAVSDYRSNCFAIQPERDLRLNEIR